MASHQVAIAKASLAAGLLRPDPTSVARDEITALHTSLDRALAHCSRANIQSCKEWLLRYLVSSSNRVGLLGKYLLALSGSFEDNANANSNSNSAANTNTKQTQAQRPSTKRKRLHILYLLNDLFHHTKYHNSSSAAFSTLSGSLQPHMVELLSYAASYDREKNPKHHKRLAELLDIWQEHGYFGADYVGKLREVVANSAVSGPIKTSATPGAEGAEQPDRKSRDAPFIMPATHGDQSAPFYDLPAANLIPHIVPNSTAPLRPDLIKPLFLTAGPADQKLVSAVKAFLNDVDRIYGPGDEPEQKDGGIVDIDELGQTVIRDEITGEILEGETYYGWSRSFCQQMKKRNARDSRRGSRSRSHSRSRSRSRSRSPHKRRRYSDSASDDSRYRSSSRSRSPRRDRRYDSRSRSRSRSYSPPSAPPKHQPSHPRNPYAQPPGFPPQPPQMPYNGGNFPPPPPPPNYQGAWPPPPPQSFSNFPPPFQQMPQMPPGLGPYNFPPLPGGRGWHPPPPPGRGWR